MTLPWFRMWHARLLADARVARLSDLTRGHYLQLLVLQGAGHVPTSDHRLVERLLGTSKAKLRASRDDLLREGLIRPDYTSQLFEDMQKPTDATARDRMAKMRARKSSRVTDTVTLRERYAVEDRGEMGEGAASAFRPLVAAPAASSRSSATVGSARVAPGDPADPGRAAQSTRITDLARDLASRARLVKS